MKQEGKKRIWSDYQKEIADDKFYFVRSCIRQTFFPGSDSTFIRILRDVLGKDIYENPDHTTCTGIGYHTEVVPFPTIQTVVARNFALMREKGYVNYTPSCVTSFGIYTEILETWHHFPQEKEKTREYLRKATGREFEEPDNLAHTSDVLYKFRNEIAAKAKYRLINKHTGKPLKVVDHIGCHYAKMFPSKGVGGAEYPQVLAGLVEAFGGEVIDYPERRHCCGFGFRQYFVQANRGYSISASKKKFESMEPFQPDFIITNCPGCNYFMDRWQYALGEMEGKTYGQNGEGIPVLTYEEVAGLVLGFDPWEMGMQMHQTDVEPLLKKMGVEYDPNQKYKGPNGEDLGVPMSPRFVNEKA
ncbi:MAG: heterodisulfide reductase-related iron-sulfur binding cluster [Tenuifilum sp.]|uniref:heterodisulfide reductase-related iron-sulfur binding cluster n=1 Tax=Tenuifilum sp. TaxID=2760880 RepID=UPI001B462EC6|nr:heterodisulfide reductase subunit B [Bacteroidales bacterium]HOK60138.1 heterodisulfide reductase-related iron-sulfur binding cluster [Tenuifilum sp.]MBP9029597.1 heterodisulfide reductase subunit B [Bacteroidales bacterium]HOK85609.1 heterodisulfide reductase-related iron-sulfur binding cluster [Tenuifilum sp.]HON69627.1 heterodisulfide reductase-related iron-sulfur binding cluster [Tenuifilum sp.]